MPILFNMAQRFALARQKKRDHYISAEGNKVGNLRAGSTGMQAEGGEIAGACHRKSLLRSMGYEVDPPSDDKYIMFELGYANEDQIFEQLQATLAEGEVILREDEIPIEWFTSNGTKVTGRPDMVICRKEPTKVFLPLESKVDVTKLVNEPGVIQITGSTPPVFLDQAPTPLLLLELKSVHSIWSAKDVLLNKKPKTDNLLQAGHYMWKLGVPGKLIYKSYSQLGQGMAGDEHSWVQKQFPRIGQPGSEYFEYNDKKGTIKHLKQFELVFDLEFDTHGRLQYRVEGTEKWTPTLITKQYIERYFEYVATMQERKDLGPRPSTIDPHGKKLGYKSCDYCPLKSTCDSADRYSKQLGPADAFDKWLLEVHSQLQPPAVSTKSK